MRTRAERRHNNWTKARCKRKIAKEIYWTHYVGDEEYYNNLHQYSKIKFIVAVPCAPVKQIEKEEAGMVVLTTRQ